MKRKPAEKQKMERNAVIRRQNLVQRHQKAAAMSTLRTEIARHTANRNYQMELDRLHEASLRHTGLDAVAARRMADLQALVR